MQPQCPFCRDDFSPRDVRKLCVDMDDVPSATTVAPQVDRQAQRLLDGIARITDVEATVEEMQGVIEQCNDYYNAQPDSPVRARLRFVRESTD